MLPAEGKGDGEGREAKFILISSSLGSIGAMESAVPSLAYGFSKAAADYFVRKVHFEEQDITTLAVHPGYVVFPLFSPRSLALHMGSMEHRLCH